jgi:hypothetical protein
MRNILISAALISAAAVAAPASAQYYPGRDYGYDRGYDYQGQDIRARIHQLHDRIHRATQRGAISRREAFRLNREIDRLERLYQRYSYNGLNRREHFDLQQRIQNVRAQLREDRRDGRWDDRYDRYGRW